MTFTFHFFLVLVVPILCHSTEYCVRPTDSNTIPFQNGRTCQTLNEYIDDSAYYFTSNTRFRFLPGNHEVNAQVIIQNIANLSLEAFNSSALPLVLSNFLCSKCSAFEFQNVTNITFKGMNIMYSNATISNFKMRRVYEIAIALTKNLHLSNITVMGGIIIRSANSTTISNAVIYNTIHNGIHVTGYTHNTKIVNTKVINALSSGIDVEGADETVITQTIVMNCALDGINFRQSTKSTVTYTHIFNSYRVGVGLWSSRYFVIANIAVVHSHQFGIYLEEAENGTVKNAKAMENLAKGVAVISSSNVTLGESEIRDSIDDAVFLQNVTDSTVYNTTTVNSSKDGILIDISQNVIIRNIRVLKTVWFGLITSRSFNISLYNATVLDSSVSILVGFTSNATVTRVETDNSSTVGIYIVHSNNTTIRDTVVKNTKNVVCSDVVRAFFDRCSTTEFFGISTFITNSTVIANTSIQSGMMIHRSEHTSFWNISVNVTNYVLISLSNHTKFHNSYVTSSINLGRNFREVSVTKSNYVVFSNVVFFGFTGPHHTSVTYLPGVLCLAASNHVAFRECTFKNNYISALKVTNSAVFFSGNIHFKSNHAIKGGAIFVSQESFLHIDPNAKAIFENNSALYGGAIYIDEYDRPAVYETVKHNGAISLQIKQRPCFLTGDKFNRSLYFIDNTAQFGGDILYGGDLEGAYTTKSSQEQCITLFRSISSISPHKNQLSLVTSEPSRACHCNGSYKPDCYTLSKSISIYPGQATSIPAVLVGQGLGTVVGSVFADFLDDTYQPSLETLQESQQVSQHQCNNLSYTIFAQQDNVQVVLVLTASKGRVPVMTNETTFEAIEIYHQHLSNAYPFMFLELPVYVNITLLPCPPGFKLRGNPASCNCIEMLQTLPGVTCNIQHQTVSRSKLVWIGSTKGDNETTTIMTAEYCPLRYCKGDSVNVSLQQPDSQCNYGHSGILCGGCPPNLSTVLGSAQCLSCSNKYLALFIPLVLSGFLLVFFVKVFDITVSSGTIHGLIFYANIIKVNEDIFLPQGERTLLSVFISWINLDLGIQICFFDGLTALWKTWLQFVFPFYIWVIVSAIIIAAKHSRRVSKVMGNNSVPVLATLFLLSYAKLLRTVITALSYSVVKHPHGQMYVWSADGNIDYLGPQHTPLFVAAVAALVFLYLPYTLFLLVGQWLYKCRAHSMVRLMAKMKPFLDAHYGCLKERHRYWFGTLLLMRALILLLSTLIPISNIEVITFSVSVTALALVLFEMLCSPYSVTFVSQFETSFFINLAALGLATFYTSTAESQTVAAYVSISIAFFQFLALLAFKVCKILKEKTQLWKRSVEWLTSFKTEREVEDDLAFLEYNREENEMDEVNCTHMEGGDEDGGLMTSEERPTYGI